MNFAEEARIEVKRREERLRVYSTWKGEVRRGRGGYWGRRGRGGRRGQEREAENRGTGK